MNFNDFVKNVESLTSTPYCILSVMNAGGCKNIERQVHLQLIYEYMEPIYRLK